MSAMAATSWTAFDPNWYPHAGATNHITPDINNLVHKTPYTGPDQIHIGDDRFGNRSYWIFLLFSV